MRRTLLLALVALAPLPLLGQAAPLDSNTVRASRELMVAMRAGEAALTGMNLAMDRERQRVPAQLPPLFFDRAKTAFERDLPELVEKMALIYARHFSRDELVRHLDAHRVGTRLLFGGSLVRQPYMHGRNYRVVGDLTNADISKDEG